MQKDGRKNPIWANRGQRLKWLSLNIFSKINFFEKTQGAKKIQFSISNKKYSVKKVLQVPPHRDTSVCLIETCVFVLSIAIHVLNRGKHSHSSQIIDYGFCPKLRISSEHACFLEELLFWRDIREEEKVSIWSILCSKLGIFSVILFLVGRTRIAF